GSDVCSSDLGEALGRFGAFGRILGEMGSGARSLLGAVGGLGGSDRRGTMGRGCRRSRRRGRQLHQDRGEQQGQRHGSAYGFGLRRDLGGWGGRTRLRERWLLLGAEEV